MKNKYTFECSSVDILNKKTIGIVISKNPIKEYCEGYFESGTISCPEPRMILRHIESGYDFIVQVVDKTVPYQHKISLIKTYKNIPMPKVNAGDSFISNGFITFNN